MLSIDHPSRVIAAPLSAGPREEPEPAETTSATSATRGEPLPPAVAAIGALHFTGNLIPSSWYQQLKLPSGRPDLVGCTLLGEIVYQYRPQPVRDEVTGEILHYVKRFARDQFCAPVAYFTGKFGLTPDQVRQGLRRLETAGYITREYRTITVAGREVHGMTFVAPVPAAIDRITRPSAATTRPGATPRPGVTPPVSIPERVVGQPEEVVGEPMGAVAQPAGMVSQPEGAVCTPLYKESSISPQENPTPPPISPQPVAEAPPTEQGGCCDSTDNTNEVLIPSSPKQPEDPAPPRQPTPVVEPNHSASPLNREESPADRDNRDPLVFDFHLAHLDQREKAAFQHRLARLSAPLNQHVLDEYNSALGGGTPIRSKWGWLEYLIRKALQGEFIPTADLAERRQVHLEADFVTQPTHQPERVPSAVWRTHREALASLVEPGEYQAYVLPLRGVEEGDRLWLEAPNRYSVDWVKAHWVVFEQVLQAQTRLLLGVRLEAA
jgi:hypothetical protein